MASILSSLSELFNGGTPRRKKPSLLPTTQQDAAILGSDYINRQYERRASQALFVEEEEEDNYDLEANGVEMQEAYTEEEVVSQAYDAAKTGTYRPRVYVSDFYRALNQRIPADGSQHGVVWRIDVDHPLATVLLDVIGADPTHVIQDVYGEQLIFEDVYVHAAVNWVLDQCKEYNLAVYPTPEGEEEEEEEEGGGGKSASQPEPGLNGRREERSDSASPVTSGSSVGSAQSEEDSTLGEKNGTGDDITISVDL